MYIFKHLNYYRISKVGASHEPEKHRKLRWILRYKCSFLVCKPEVTRIPTTASEALCVWMVWSSTSGDNNDSCLLVGLYDVVPIVK